MLILNMVLPKESAFLAKLEPASFKIE